MASHLADLVEAKPRVAVWAVPALETCAAVVGALAAGVPVVPINPKAGERELAHIVADCAPALLLTARDRASTACRRATSRGRPVGAGR